MAAIGPVFGTGFLGDMWEDDSFAGLYANPLALQTQLYQHYYNRGYIGGWNDNTRQQVILQLLFGQGRRQRIRRRFSSNEIALMMMMMCGGGGGRGGGSGGFGGGFSTFAGLLGGGAGGGLGALMGPQLGSQHMLMNQPRLWYPDQPRLWYP